MNKEKINYTITRATREQVEYIYDMHIRSAKIRNYDLLWYIACNDEGKILGHINAEAKALPDTPHEQDWFIPGLRIYDPANRRKGIGTALLRAVIRDAQAAGVRTLYGMTAQTVTAHSFWEHQGAAFSRHGKANTDKNDPERYGNHTHWFMIRLEEIRESVRCREEGITIAPASREQSDIFYSEHILPKNPDFFADKRPVISALTASDRDGNTLGFIAVFPYEMFAPLDGQVYWIVSVHVEPEHRRRGIGSVLLYAMEERAKADGMRQLMTTDTDEIREFWYRNGYSVLFWKHISARNSIVTAAKRFW